MLIEFYWDTTTPFCLQSIYHCFLSPAAEFSYDSMCLAKPKMFTFKGKFASPSSKQCCNESLFFLHMFSFIYASISEGSISSRGIAGSKVQILPNYPSKGYYCFIFLPIGYETVYLFISPHTHLTALGVIILFQSCSSKMSFPGGASGKEPTCRCRRRKRCGFDPWVGKILWRRAWQPTPVFLLGESHGQWSLTGYSP